MEWIDRLTNWYEANARDLPWRKSGDPYRVLLSEVMLQQTRVAAVLGYYERFLSACPDIAALAGLPEEQLLKLWEGLGYYSRARNLKKAALAIQEKHGGRFPDTYEGLLALPGVGPYTAGAVASIAFGLPEPAVDGNVLRVMARLQCNDEDIADPKTRLRVSRELKALLPGRDAGKANQALMELGACVCLPAGAQCHRCPVSEDCLARARGKTRDLPRRAQKKPRRMERKTVFALRSQQGLYYGCRRKDTGLLAGLWQLPERMGALTAPEAALQLDAWGLRPQGELQFYERKHVFTHIQWNMLVCCASVAGTPPDGWIQLDESRPLPTAYRTALPSQEGSASATKRSGAGPTKVKG